MVSEKCQGAPIAAMQSESESHMVCGTVFGSDCVSCQLRELACISLLCLSLQYFPFQNWVLILRIIGFKVTTKVFLGNTEINPSQRLIQMPLIEISSALTAWLDGLRLSDLRIPDSGTYPGCWTFLDGAAPIFTASEQFSKVKTL